MKISTKITAALIALGIVAQAGADPVVYLTGSTAFRSTVYAALASGSGTNAGGVFDSAPTFVTFGSSSLNGGTYMVFHGNIAGAPVYINCAWSGSEAGIASACNTSLANIVDGSGTTVPLAGSPETWLNVNNVTLNNTATSTNPATGSPLFETSSHGADLTQSDTSQAISWTPSVNGTQTQLKDFGTEAIVTFTLSRNAQSAPTREWLSCTNITLPQLNVLLANGFAPAGFFSGNTNDNDMNVYLVGRNMGSGTRMNMLGDSGYGAHSQVAQFSVGGGIETTHTATLTLAQEFNNGYEGGGDVAKALGITNGASAGSCQQQDPFFSSNPGWLAIGYVAPADALNTANYGGAPTNNWIAVDGVVSSNGAIEHGQWWLWGHEHLYGSSSISGTALTVGNQLFVAVQKTINSLGYGTNSAAHDPAIPVGLMTVTKGSDVAFPSF